MPASRSAAASVLLTLWCLLPVWCCTGCSSKAPQNPPHITKTAKQKVVGKASSSARRTPATQRPYTVGGITYSPIASARGYRERGIASWYGEPFHGRRTSNGEIYDMHSDTAAHKTLPMNTRLLVHNLDNGRSTVVRINDRGPFVQDRIIDLSYRKAQELGLLAKGTARVEIVALHDRETVSVQRDQAEAPMSRSKPLDQKVTIASLPERPQPTVRSGTGSLFVQLSVFDREDEARSLAKELVAQGRIVKVQPYPAAGIKLYRVLVFASHSLSEALRYEARMRASGFRYARLVEQ